MITKSLITLGMFYLEDLSPGTMLKYVCLARRLLSSQSAGQNSQPSNDCIGCVSLAGKKYGRH